MKNTSKKSYIKLFLTGIAILNLADLLIFCIKFLFVYTDSDQTILWLAGSDMSRGLFYEPAFYGQAYNTMIEALLAVPFILSGVFVPYALSLSTIILSYSVIWLFAWYFYKKQDLHFSILCLALPIIFPTEFQIMICISRGFVPGIVFTMYGMFCLLTYNGKLKLLLTGLFITLGIIFNPNCSIILVPFGVYYFFKPNAWNRNELLFIFFGSLPAIIFVWFSKWFYSSHPNYNLHVFQEPFAYSLKTWIYSVSEIFYIFKGLFPVVNNLGCLSIILLLVLLVLILKKSDKMHEKLAALAGFSFIVFSFGINKVSDGSGSPFFPYSRMFLGIPVLYFFFISILKQYIMLKVPVYSMLFLIAGIFIFKTLSLPDRINYTINHNTGAVNVAKIKSICNSCDSIQRLLAQTNTDLIVIKSKRDQINYGCPALINDFKTIHPAYERRLWVYEKEMFIPRKQFILYAEHPVYDSNVVAISKNYYKVSLPAAISLKDWFRLNKYPLRKYGN